METTCQQTELEMLIQRQDALESVLRRQSALLERLACLAPGALLAAMTDADRVAMPLLVQRAQDSQRRA